MSYGITAYFTDECISETLISSYMYSHTGYYGDEKHYVDGLTRSTTFTATPAEGCKFTQWVYRIGSTSAEQQFGTDNPFTYSGDEDIYIRAEGEAVNTSWTRHIEALGTVSSLKSVDINLGEYEIYRFSVIFEESGTASFYSVGTDIDAFGYLGTTMGWDSENGEPKEYLVSDDDGNGAPNFSISYSVEAGEKYYVWVRSTSPDSSGNVTLYIDAPGETQEEPKWKVTSEDVGKISEDTTKSLSISSCGINRYAVVFASSGTANFYTTGTVDTYGYLSTTTEFDSDTGVPNDPIAENDDSGGDSNFLISCEVTAGQTYYIWVRGWSEDTTGTTILNIEVPATASRPSDFSWTLEKKQGETFNLSAEEWNNFTTRINSFRKYKGLTDYEFTSAYSGNDFTASMYNQARLAIQEIDGYGTYIPTVYSEWQISAYMMNVLVSELNSIP